MALFFPSMIVGVAKEAGMKVPDFSKKNKAGKRTDDFDRNVYPHFHVFCEVTLGKPLRSFAWHDWAAHNARVIAGLDAERIKQVTFGNLVDMGLEPSC